MSDKDTAYILLGRIVDAATELCHLALNRTKWRPIETAPDDERTVLLSVPTLYGKWNKSIPVAGRRERDFWVIYNADEAIQRVEPTHWMPLPAAPSPSCESSRTHISV